MRDVTFFFVVDGLKFERQAWMLSVSLRMEMGFDFPIIAYFPEEKLAQVTTTGTKLFEKCDVSIRTFNPVNAEWASPYPHGNKILASLERRETAHSVFLDSDTICAGLLNFQPSSSEPYLAAVPEGVPTWSRYDEDWQPVYEMFGLDLPNQRVNLVRGRGISMLPYFNAGLVGFRESEDENGKRLPDVWYDTALKLDHNDAIENKRPWLDQLSLPVAAARMAANLAVLDKSYNTSLFRRNVDPQLNSQLLHYHMISVFNQWPQCRKVIDTAIEWCPEKNRGKLKRHLRRWQFSDKFADTN